MFPNRTRLGPKGHIRRQADFGTTSLVVPKGIDSETLDVLPNLYSIRNRAEMQGTDICFCLIYKTFTT